MSPSSKDAVLTSLESPRYSFGRDTAARVAKSLIRFHEALLVLRAFPPSPAVFRRSQELLNRFWKRVELVQNSGTDMDEFDPLEVSGIAGTTMQDALGFDLARWLVRRMPGKVDIAWEDLEDERALGAVWPRLMPLLEEDTLAEANIPWQKWLEAAQGNRRRSPSWMLERFAELAIPEAEKGRLYDSLRIPLRWHLQNSRISRTRNSRPVDRVFYHDAPLITRSDTSLQRELARRPPEFKMLSRTAGESIMDLIREVMLVRYRELYGTTLGDARSVVRADVGRGVSIYLFPSITSRLSACSNGLRSDSIRSTRFAAGRWRGPLRKYCAASLI
ncbi:MAG: hypothetical protein DMG81_20800 [Acidobacteria bacterium]|nr:MAG: hypothetical protein DMG81_20800 [Acidobacteriota bacterium]